MRTSPAPVTSPVFAADGLAYSLNDSTPSGISIPEKRRSANGNCKIQTCDLALRPVDAPVNILHPQPDYLASTKRQLTEVAARVGSAVS
jgi:hypothetical protein